MALKKLIEFENGTVAEYHKIKEIKITPYERVENICEKTEDGFDTDVIIDTQIIKGYLMTIVIVSFATQVVRNRNAELFIDSSHVVKVYPYDNFNSADLFKQAYDYLKTLPQFEGAEDT